MLMVRADSLREYLTGAAFDGGLQTNPVLSLGNFRSSVEALHLGMTVDTLMTNVSALYASGANPIGPGILRAVDASHLTWQPNGASGPGPAVLFSGTNDLEIVEALNAPGQYLRVQATPPFIPSFSTITLAYLVDNVFGIDDVLIAGAASGISEYRATIVRNERTIPISSLQRCLALLGTTQTSDLSQLPASGAGSISTSLGTFNDWPKSGWCQIRTSGGAVREVVYYTSRTSMVLTVPAVGRGLFGTTPSAGSNSDLVYAVPGMVIGVDPAGIQNAGQSIQQVVNGQTAPSGVTWNMGISLPTGLQIGSLGPSKQLSIWMWRQMPAGAVATPLAVIQLVTAFNTF